MRFENIHIRTIARLALAVALLSGIAVFVGHQVAPLMPLATITLYAALGAAVLFAVIVTASAVSLTFNQFILRKGGTDAQWFWFSSEPKGLVQLREQAAAKISAEKN